MRNFLRPSLLAVLPLGLIAGGAGGAQNPAGAKVEFASRSGLKVWLDGVPIVQGSLFQYYAPGFKKGYYSSLYNDQTVVPTSDGYRATFASPDGMASGTVEVKVSGGAVETTYRFEWSGKEPALVELGAGLLSAAPWRGSAPNVVGPGASATDAKAYGRRLLASEASETTFTGGPVTLRVNADPGATIFDAQGYDADFARGKSLYWAGRQGIPVSPGQPATVMFRFALNGTFSSATAPAVVGVEATPAIARIGQSERQPLIPAPKIAVLSDDRPVEITGRWAFPAGRPRRFDDFVAALARRFDAPRPAAKSVALALDGGQSDFKLIEGAYRIVIRKNGVSVLGQGDEGLRNAFERLASLAFARDGRLFLPIGRIEDEPRRTFRGVHLFVGREALAFQERLWTRVLRPLGLNKVVLQCERTRWDALPGIESPITMPKEDLVRLFRWYRSQAVEPIPLVQSWGHAEWIFANGKNLDLAYNRDVPYALDPRKPEAKALLTKLWSEVVAATGAKTIHFGLDEVDMRGMEPPNPSLVTAMWKEHLPFLGGIARKNGVGMMLWGDKLLGPGEAPDAAFGGTKADAQARRDAVPREATIADWHYKPDPRPQTFLKSLQIFKMEGLKAIASTWYRPENVRGFTLAADLERAGTLQTTWAGYESNETNMLANMAQFSAMVLSADYSWSGRQEPLDRLGYDPTVVFRRMYFGSPQPLGVRRGFVLGPTSGPTTGPRGALAEIERETGVRLSPLALPIRLRSLGSGLADPMEATLRLAAPAPARRLWLGLESVSRLGENDPVATIEVVLADGRTVTRDVRYGLDVRASEDKAALTRSAGGEGLSAVPVELPAAARVARIVFRAAAPNAGLVVRAATLE